MCCMVCLQDALFIGAKLDSDVHGDSCRLAFYGRLLHLLDTAAQTGAAGAQNNTAKDALRQLKVYKVTMAPLCGCSDIHVPRCVPPC